MKFFFPDSQDFVDPSFDMITEERSEYRVRQRDDLYAHEIFSPPPFDGLLVNMALVNGYERGTAKYSAAQRNRLLNEGIQEFFRLPKNPRLETLGDCGAYSYKDEDEPPFGAEDAFDFYQECGFDYGLSVDHIIEGVNLAFDVTIPIPGMDSDIEKFIERQEITKQLALEFKNLCDSRQTNFEPVGVAQGWSPKTYASAVKDLQSMGYSTVALGGLNREKTTVILAILRAVYDILAPDTGIHLLGVTRIDSMAEFSRLGVTSFDSTSPLKSAFMHDKKNYFIGDRTFSALRVPQVDGKDMKKCINKGIVDAEKARKMEQRALALLNDFERDQATLEDTLEAVVQYGKLCKPDTDRTAQYRQTLMERPWERCDCEICTKIGIHVLIFRGAERNRRRGLHNVYQFRQSLSEALVAERDDHLTALIRAE